jgi:hypothetical protein
MRNTSQQRALKNYRARLAKRGISRFEVLGLDSDRDLIRALAKRLAKNDPEAVRIRTTVSRSVQDVPREKGGIVAALLRSPLVGSDLKIERPLVRPRKIVL